MLLLVEALGGEGGGGARFGVFSSHRWSRSPRGYGGGACFALSLHPKVACYPWVPRSGGADGESTGGQAAALASALAAVDEVETVSVAAKGELEDDAKGGDSVAGANASAEDAAAVAEGVRQEEREGSLRLAVDIFMYSSASVILMGGSAATSAAALRMDSDLMRGFSEHCDTFQNEPLAGKGNEEFSIGQIEVFDFVV